MCPKYFYHHDWAREEIIKMRLCIPKATGSHESDTVANRGASRDGENLDILRFIQLSPWVM